MVNNNYNPGQNILAKTLFFCITQATAEKKNPSPSFNVADLRLLAPHGQEQY